MPVLSMAVPQCSDTRETLMFFEELPHFLQACCVQMWPFLLRPPPSPSQAATCLPPQAPTLFLRCRTRITFSHFYYLCSLPVTHAPHSLERESWDGWTNQWVLIARLSEQPGLNRDQRGKGLLQLGTTDPKEHWAGAPWGTSPPCSQVSGQAQGQVDIMPDILLGPPLWAPPQTKGSRTPSLATRRIQE